MNDTFNIMSIFDDDQGYSTNKECEMNDTFNIRMLCRTVTIHKQEVNQSAGPQYWGRAYLQQHMIFVDSSPGNPTVRVCFHELFHQYLFYTGFFRDFVAEEEQVCEIYGAFMEDLIMENGMAKLSEMVAWLTAPKEDPKKEKKK